MHSTQWHLLPLHRRYHPHRPVHRLSIHLLHPLRFLLRRLLIFLRSVLLSGHRLLHRPSFQAHLHHIDHRIPHLQLCQVISLVFPRHNVLLIGLLIGHHTLHLQFCLLFYLAQCLLKLLRVNHLTNLHSLHLQ